jgi:hypothetical protein
VNLLLDSHTLLRLLVAQSMIERLPVVSVDAQLDACGITRLW